MLPVFLVFFLLDMLSEEYWHSVVRSRELIQELGDVSSRHLRISRDSSGIPITKYAEGPDDDDDSDDGDDGDDGDDEMSLEEWLCKIKQLMLYIHNSEISINDFFGFRNDRPDIERGILFEHFLLLLLKYLELLKKEEDEEEEEEENLFNLSEDDETEFEKRKHMAKIILGLLKLAASDKFTNPRILAILHDLIDTFMRQFPDAMYLVCLGGFRETGIESLSLVEVNNPPGTMCFLLNTQTFHDERIFQTLGSLANFPLSSYFTSIRLTETFVFLLGKYCAPRYTETEMKAVILNVCAFLIQTLSAEEAFEAINHIFTELERHAEMFQFILEAIPVCERENLRKLLEDPQFPVHPEESLKRISDYLGGDFVEKYKSFCKKIQSAYPKEKLKELLKALSEKYFVARVIFARLFNNSYIERGRKLSLNAEVCGKIQDVIDHSKILSECKEAPRELHEQRSYLFGILPERILVSSGCGNKTTISAALEHLRKYHQRIYDDRQAEWRAGGVALQRRESRFDGNSVSVPQFQEHQKLTDKLKQIDAVMSELQKYSSSKLLKDVQDDNTKKIERVNAQIKVFDDQKHRMRLEHTRMLQEVKKSILDRLFGGQE